MSIMGAYDIDEEKFVADVNKNMDNVYHYGITQWLLNNLLNCPIYDMTIRGHILRVTTISGKLDKSYIDIDLKYDGNVIVGCNNIEYTSMVNHLTFMVYPNAYDGAIRKEICLKEYKLLYENLYGSRVDGVYVVGEDNNVKL